MRGFGVLMLGGLILLTACSAPAVAGAAPASRQIIAMDTLMQFTVYGQEAEVTVQTAVEEVQRLEGRLSRTAPDSEVTNLNARAGERVAVSETLYDLIVAAKQYALVTGGEFDMTVAPVVEAWGFGSERQRVPEQAELQELLPLVDSSTVSAEADENAYWVTLGAGQSVDLGGIAKGYATDCLAKLFADQGVKQGWASLGGNVLAWGTRPDGKAWQIGVQDPQYPEQERVVGLVGLQDAFAVTSGSYQRYFEEDGVTYHHILDPDTGYPADSDLMSVTVVADAEGSGEGGAKLPGNGTMCDALSTALFVMGEEQALDFWRDRTQEFDLILVTGDGRVVVTSGIADSFTPEKGSGYLYETAT